MTRGRLALVVWLSACSPAAPVSPPAVPAPPPLAAPPATADTIEFCGRTVPVSAIELSCDGAWDEVDLAPLARTTRLRELHVSSAHLLNTQVLAKLTHLRELDLSWTSLVFLDPVKPLRDLRRLDVQGCDISSLAQLADLVELRHLDVSYNRLVTDLEPLAGMAKLAWLDVSGTSVSDVRPLAGAFGLEQLRAYDTRVRTRTLKPLMAALSLRRIAVRMLRASPPIAP